MKIAIVGGGPGGLYFALLMKKRYPAYDITVYERNRADDTFGFGVVFSDRALEFLQADDPETYERITPQLEAWVDLVVAHRGERYVIDGIGFDGRTGTSSTNYIDVSSYGIRIRNCVMRGGNSGSVATAGPTPPTSRQRLAIPSRKASTRDRCRAT